MTALLETYGQGTYGSEFYGGSPEPEPTFMVEVETAPGAWAAVECDVRAIDIHQGRSKQLDQFTAATATITFDDASDRYNAWNPAGIWATRDPFRTDVPLRITAVWGLVGVKLFTGTTDEVIDTWPGAGSDAVTEVRATDALKGLARSRPALSAGVGAGDLPGARVNRILDAVSYTGPRAVEAGTLAMAASTLDDTAANLCDEARECEFGAFYVAGDGTVSFRARDSIVTDPRQANVQWTFDDQDRAGPCYSDLKLTANDEQVFNLATVTRPAGVPQVASVADSLAWYGPRTYTRTLPFVADASALTLAQAVVAAHAYNERRVDEIMLDAKHDPDLWPAATGVRLLDRVRVIRRTGVVIDTELQVQSIHHSIVAGGDGTPATWDVTLGTSNARIVRDAGQWDVGQWDVAKWSV